MGRWNRKTTVEECWSLRASDFHKWGVFKEKIGFAGGSVEWKNKAGEVTASLGFNFTQGHPSWLTLSYTLTKRSSGEQRNFHYDIELTTTACNYGGRRYWFICPLVTNGIPCRRRITVLYLPSGGNYYGCRHCYDLTYQSCQEHDARVDRLVKNPELIDHLIKSGSLTSLILASKAVLKLERK